MRGQIYFLCTVDLEHDSLWGHYWVVASSREKASRSPRTLLQPTVREHILLHICVCVWVAVLVSMSDWSETWTQSPLGSPALFHIGARWD